MKTVATHTLSFDEFDDLGSSKPEYAEFDDVVERAISRRGFLSGVLSVGASTFVMGVGAGVSTSAEAAGRFGFIPVSADTLDTVTLPDGFNWHVVVKWGDELFDDSIPFDEESRGNSDSQAKAFGDNNDGMSLFTRDGKTILVVNNEYANRSIIFGNRQSQMPETDDDVKKGMIAHGITVCEISNTDGTWRLVKGSGVNRRITPESVIEIAGPASGHALMQTVFDPTGSLAKGTWNNCGNGRTPWGTYLACEENFNGYFSASSENFEQTSDQKRYGLKQEDWGYAWSRIDSRFDMTQHPNEPHRVGYVVEIDPFDPTKRPRKLTALGRFKHENAELLVAPNGQVVVYMGDDERGEFIYKYVSHGTVSTTGDNAHLLDAGTLYAAKFHDDQTGEWLELSPETTGMESYAEICIRTRIAGSAVGATTMDRPEWVAANPNNAEVYCALTNNKNRGIKPNNGGDPTPATGPNPRPANEYGQIVRWVPDNNDHTSTHFKWDLFVLAGNPKVHSDANAGSKNIHAANMFNSPDGIAFDTNGFLWIQTDGEYNNEGDFAGMGNNQMLVGDTTTGRIERFMVGPKECEVTGLTWSEDRRTLFVGIQHPGEKNGESHWPNGGDSVPRSAVIAIQRDDGETIG